MRWRGEDREGAQTKEMQAGTRERKEEMEMESSLCKLFPIREVCLGRKSKTSQGFSQLRSA